MIAMSCSRPARCLWRPDGGRCDEGCRCSGWSIVSTADLVAVFAALAATVVMGFAGVAIDVGYWQMAQRNMQGAADRAAYPAVIGAGAGGGASPTTQAKGITASISAAHASLSMTAGAYILDRGAFKISGAVRLPRQVGSR